MEEVKERRCRREKGEEERRITDENCIVIETADLIKRIISIR